MSFATQEKEEIKPGDLVRLHPRNGAAAIREWGIGIFIRHGRRRPPRGGSANDVYWLTGLPDRRGFRGYNDLDNLEKVK